MRPEAIQDTEEARDYYEAPQTGLGQLFLDRLRATLGSISTIPEMYGKVWRNVRVARLRQFTYLVYYRVYNDRVEVLAVMRSRRSTLAWRGRV